MGDDPATSVVDRYHRVHDVPTMTIQALAFRAAEHIGGFARNGEI